MVSLRHFRKEDVESIRMNMYPDMAAPDIVDLIEEWNSLLFQGFFFEMFAVVSDGRIVGSASLVERSQSAVSAGVEIFSDEKRKGVGTETFSRLLQHASEKGYRIVIDQVRKDNAASIRLHEKLGFETDGYVYRNRRDHEVILFLKLL